jgi:hypothetical protein
MILHLPQLLCLPQISLIIRLRCQDYIPTGINPFKALLTAEIFSCSAASPAPVEATATDDGIYPSPHISCYTATVTQPIYCPVLKCGPHPDCIIRETTTAPCPPRHCKVTPTVTVAGTCPTCQRGCGIDFVTVTPTHCPPVY